MTSRATTWRSYQLNYTPHIYTGLLILAPASLTLLVASWCAEWDLNPHVIKTLVSKTSAAAITPPTHIKYSYYTAI